MIVYHHGVIPVDYLYLVARVYLETGVCLAYMDRYRDILIQVA